MTKGWKQESSRHALARKGIRTGRKKKIQGKFHSFGEYWSKAQVKKGKILAKKHGWSKFKVKKGTYIGSYTLFVN
jgi:hypothetical protein